MKGKLWDPGLQWISSKRSHHTDQFSYLDQGRLSKVYAETSGYVDAKGYQGLQRAAIVPDKGKQVCAVRRARAFASHSLSSIDEVRFPATSVIPAIGLHARGANRQR